jgi:hypothetical protein
MLQMKLARELLLGFLGLAEGKQSLLYLSICERARASQRARVKRAGRAF